MSFSHSILKPATGLLAALAVLANCSPTSEEPASPDPAPTETETNTPETTEPSREARLAEDIEKMREAFEVAKSTNGPGSPALWTLSDDDTTIHIFGTVHILKPETEWRTDTFDEAFDAADTLVLEIAMETPEDEQAVAMTMMRASVFDDGRSLSDVLSADELAIVKDAAKSMGIPGASIDVQEPWAVGLTLLNVQMMADGFDPTSGVESVLTKEAKDQGKAFQSLETAEFQIGVFDTMSMEAQVDMLVSGAMTTDLVDTQLSSLIDEWADGDVEGLGVIAANPETAGGDEFYNALFLERNQNWVPQIEALLDEPGTIMIAVGAGHLAGPDSVITMLENKGHTLTRTQ